MYYSFHMLSKSENVPNFLFKLKNAQKRVRISNKSRKMNRFLTWSLKLTTMYKYGQRGSRFLLRHRDGVLLFSAIHRHGYFIAIIAGPWMYTAIALYHKIDPFLKGWRGFLSNRTIFWLNIKKTLSSHDKKQLIAWEILSNVTFSKTLVPFSFLF